MAKTDYKSTDALMRHLRNNGISISGTSQKQQLINTGYFHAMICMIKQSAVTKMLRLELAKI